MQTNRLRTILLWFLPGLVVFTLSLLWHLPAQTLVNTLVKTMDQDLPESLSIQAQGRWHQGQAQLQWQADGDARTDLGALQWDLSVWRLLLGQAHTQLDWQAGWGWATLTANANAWSQTLSLNMAKARISLDRGIPALMSLSPQLIMANGMQGDVHIDQLDLLLAPSDQRFAYWPQQLHGKISVHNWQMLQARINTLALNPGIDQETLMLNPSSQNENWALTGQISLAPDGQWQSQIQMQSQNQSPLPEWAGWLLPQQSSTDARFNKSGKLR